VHDIMWFLPDGNQMNDEHWENDFAKSFGVYLDGDGIKDVGYQSQKIVDDTFYIIFNAHYEPLDYILPEAEEGSGWCKVIDTSDGFIGQDSKQLKAGESVQVKARSTMVMKSKNPKKLK